MLKLRDVYNANAGYLQMSARAGFVYALIRTGSNAGVINTAANEDDIRKHIDFWKKEGVLSHDGNGYAIVKTDPDAAAPGKAMQSMIIGPGIPVRCNF